ncbi:MAG: NepR family anti-sigma factor [Pseudomonadota bacterium]
MSDEENLSPSQKLIQSNLQRLFQEDVEEGIPDRFADMISRLKGVQPSDVPAGSETDGQSVGQSEEAE